jgi:ABC-type transport system involved in cytochrome c biogenesis permease subunit
VHLTWEVWNALYQETVMSFALYSLGYLILIAGVAYLAHLIHIPERYIIAIAVILLGIGVVTGVQSTKHKDPS